MVQMVFKEETWGIKNILLKNIKEDKPLVKEKDLIHYIDMSGNEFNIYYGEVIEGRYKEEDPLELGIYDYYFKPLKNFIYYMKTEEVIRLMEGERLQNSIDVQYEERETKLLIQKIEKRLNDIGRYFIVTGKQIGRAHV